jgi:hypothetical protein
MSDRELLIARYVDAAPAEREQIVAHASLEADPALQADIEFEAFIQRTLTSDRDSLSQKLDLSAVSEAPLESLLNDASPNKADNKVIYFVFAGVALIISWLVYFLLSQPSADQLRVPTPAASQPQTTSTQQPVHTPAPTEPATPVESAVSASKHAPAANVHTPTTDRNQLDLDKDLAPPKVFDDKKARMPLKKR